MTTRSCPPQVEPGKALLDHWSEVRYLRPFYLPPEMELWDVGRGLWLHFGGTPSPALVAGAPQDDDRIQDTCYLSKIVYIPDIYTGLCTSLAHSHATQYAHAPSLRLTTGDRDTTPPGGKYPIGERRRTAKPL